MTTLISHTLREAPSDAIHPSHQLLTRAGYAQEIGKGSYAFLPLGRAALNQINRSLLDTLSIRASQVDLPILQAHEGNFRKDPGAAIFKDLQNRHLQLINQPDSTFEELAKQHISSYRHLPAFMQYQGPLWADEVHPGSGLFYSRMPQILGLFGALANQASIQEWVKAFQNAINRTLRGFGIPYLVAKGWVKEGDNTSANEWYYPHPAGKTQVFNCKHCGYTASAINAHFTRKSNRDEPQRPLEKVETPDCKTIEALAAFLNIPRERTAKAIFMVAEYPDSQEELIFAIIPGDRDLNEKQLAQVVSAQHLRPAGESEIEASGAVPGYGSPVGLDKIRVVVDAQIPDLQNLVAGANESGFHLINVNYERDYTAEHIAEITLPKPGDSCPQCQNALQAIRAIKIAHLEQANPEHSFMEPDGKIAPLHALHLHWFTDRLLACISEENNDQFGLILPTSSAPYRVHLVLLPDKEESVAKQADDLYQQLKDAGLEPLYDDRRDRAGVKFMDADLIGLPLRLTISKRSLSQGGVECKLRTESEAQLIPHDQLLTFIQSALQLKDPTLI